MDKWLRNNLVAKILALLLAVMLWMVVNIDEIMQPDMATPLEQTSRIVKEIQRITVNTHLDSEDYVVVKMDKTVDVILRGDRSVLSAPINPNSYEVYVDLTGLGKGVHQVPVKYRGFPSDVEVEIKPSTIEVTLEEKQRKEMVVTPEIVGKPKEGYTLGDPIVNPLKVHVKASESQLEMVAFVKGFIKVDGATSNVKKPVALKVVDVNGNIVDVEVEPAVAEITVPITHPFVTVPLQLNLVGHPPEGYAVLEIESSAETVSLFGPKEKIEDLELYKGPEINLSSLTKTQTFDLKLPNPYGLTEISPSSIKVTVKIVPSEKMEVKGVPIEIKGVTDGYKASIIQPVDGKLTLVLEGAPDRLKGITIEDIQANVILSGLPEGVHEVPLEMILPEYIKLDPTNPTTIRVEIRKDAKEASGTPSEPEKENTNEQTDIGGG